MESKYAIRVKGIKSGYGHSNILFGVDFMPLLLYGPNFDSILFTKV